MSKYKYGSKVPILELMKTDDRDLQFLAQYVYDKIFVNYTAKQWGMRPEDIDPEVTARVPVFIGRENGYFTDTYQGVPEEGYTKIFERMLNHPDIKLFLNTDFKEVISVDIENKKIYFKRLEFKGKLIFTGMIDELFKHKFGPLPYRSLDLRFETINQEFFQEVATVNYPNDYDFTRITEFKHIHPALSEKTSILKEYPKPCHPGDIPYYPIVTQENQERYNKYRDFSESFNNLILLGRLAEYRYYDMDDVVKRALEVFEEKIR